MRYVVTSFRMPIWEIKFIDQLDGQTADAALANPGGVMTIDLREEVGIGAPGIIIENATKMWCQGVSFDTISRKYPDR